MLKLSRSGLLFRPKIFSCWNFRRSYCFNLNGSTICSDLSSSMNMSSRSSSWAAESSRLNGWTAGIRFFSEEKKKSSPGFFYWKQKPSTSSSSSSSSSASNERDKNEQEQLHIIKEIPLEKMLKDGPTISIDVSTLKRHQPATDEKSLKKMNSASPFEKYLINLIKQKGPLSMKQYMKEVLTNPKYGYYMSRDVFGAKGDFITSPEISQLFGEMIGIWFVHIWELMGKPSKLAHVEFGPGRGSLMKDILRVASKFPSFKAALELHLVEISPFLRETQASNLNCQLPTKLDQVSYSGGVPVKWHFDISTIPKDKPILFIAHEFMDCMAPHHFCHINPKSGWHEILVDIDETAEHPYLFRKVYSPTPTIFSISLIPRLLSDEPDAKIEDGTLFEFSPDAQTFIEDLGQLIATTGGGGLIIDYGMDLPVFPSTIRAIRKHEFVDIFDQPGTADLSCLVDFRRLKKTASQIPNLTMYGPRLQKDFLHDMGIHARLAKLVQNSKSEEEAKKLILGYQRLVEENEIGSYKVVSFLNASIKEKPYGFE